MDSITISTSDDFQVRVPRQLAMMSKLLKIVLEEDLPGDIKINVSKMHLELVLEYAEHHLFIVDRIDKPLKSNKLREILNDPWDYDYIMRIKKNYDLVDFLLAVNYLDVGGLLELLFASIAVKFKGKDIDKIRKKYGIKEEFTEEEERQMLRENPWAPK